MSTDELTVPVTEDRRSPAEAPAPAPARRRRWPSAAGLLDGGPVSWRELALLAGLLAALAAVVSGVHVARGGFYWDDWQYASLARFPPHGGLFGAAQPALEGFRPILAGWTALVFRTIGSHAAWGLALALALSAATSLAVYLLLRTVRLAPLHAGAIALLTLLFPWADSGHLYVTNSLNNLPVILCVLGVVASLRGLDRSGRAAVVLTVCGVALYVVSVLMYEVAAAVALTAGLLYFTRAPVRRALARWSIDLLAVGGATIVVATNTPYQTHRLGATLGHARIIADQAVTVFTRALVPVDGAPAWIAAVLIAAALGSALVVYLRARPDDAVRIEIRRWALLGLGAVVALAASYAIFAPAALKYVPLAEGTGNRVNILAAPAYATLVYALAGLLGAALLSRSRRTVLRAAFPALAAAAVLVGFAVQTRRDQANWDRAHTDQDRIVAAVERTVLAGPRATSMYVYTFGGRTHTARDIPVFATLWDLRGALRTSLGRRTLYAFPVPANEHGWSCGAAKMAPSRWGLRAPYGNTYFIDIPHRRHVLIRTAAECRRYAPSYLANQVPSLYPK